MAFLGIQIPHQIGRLLSKIDVPGDKVNLSDFHITMLCFEDNWPITEISKAMEATYEVISDIVPFSVKIVKVDHFPQGESDKYPIIARITSSKLDEIRSKMAKEFDKRQIDFSKIHKDFKAHITLSYSNDKPENIEFDPIEFTITEFVLWGGDHGDDRIFVTFPLEGKKQNKSSMLLQQANIFEKIANNPLQGFFTPSYERRKVER